MGRSTQLTHSNISNENVLLINYVIIYDEDDALKQLANYSYERTTKMKSHTSVRRVQVLHTSVHDDALIYYRFTTEDKLSGTRESSTSSNE